MTKRPIPALTQLQGALTVLDNRLKKPPAAVLADIRLMVQDAIAVLQEPDPLKQRIGFVLLAIQQSTEVKVVERNGKQVTKIKIIDLELYNWAMSEVHALAGNGR